MKKKRIQINISNRWLYTFIFLGILIAIAIGIHAYGTSDPQVFGHTITEIGCTNGFCAKNGNLGIGTTNPLSNLSIGGNGNVNSTVYVTGNYDAISVVSQRNGIYSHGELVGVIGDGDTGVIASGQTYGLTAMGDVFGIVGTSVEGTGIKGAGDTGIVGWGDESGYDFLATGPGTNYGASSSIRWKNNIVTIGGALAKVLALRGVYFDWNKDHGGNHDMGFIAEEVGDVVPEVVGYEDDSIKTNHYLINGKDKVYANAVDYGALTPLLVEAIKEQQKKIDELESRIQELENKVQ